ncbi:MAG: tRNA (adenosine(37)-N6)-dimethylallyltransferase MiaA [bacterium]|nr:tRNA (adenosine(37)-N6)-dimethylallyltransferase MiaA [bacterium]
MKNKAYTDNIIVIVGPTASGKSDLGVKIAQKINGEIISADSRQVYRGMDIGTGKITKKEMSNIPHHLLDVVLPNTDFSAGKFKKLASKKIAEIIKRKKTPMVVGGTGFWIDSLIYNWPLPEAKSDKKLRSQLEKQTAKQLFTRLKKLDPERAQIIEPGNKRRLIRALEIVLITGKKVPQFNLQASYSKSGKKYMEIGSNKLEIKIIGLNPPKKILEQKIYKRLIQRLDSGMIREIKNLKKSGVSWKRLDDFGLEYRFVSRYLRGLITYDEMVEQTYGAIRKYSIRQMRWLKRNKSIRWFADAKKVKNYIFKK